MRRITAVLIVVWLWFCVPFAAEPVTVRVKPQVGVVPFRVDIVLHVTPSVSNREVCLSWGLQGDEIEMYSRSCQALEGAVTTVTFRYVRYLREPGMWMFRGEVRQDTGRWLRSVPVDVRAVGGV